MKIALFLPNWIGDAAMATPALRAIRERFPAAEILAVQRPYVAAVLEGLDLIDRNLLWSRDRSTGLCGRRLAQQLRRESLDLAVLFPNSLRSAWMAFWGGARRRVGFARDARRWLLTDALPPRPRSQPYPVLDSYCELASAVGADAASRKMELAITEKDRQDWQAFLDRCRLHSQRAWVTLNPGGAFGAAKHWPPESFAALARRIADVFERNVLVLCGPAERQMAERIVSGADHRRVVGFHDQPLSIGLSKAAVYHSELLVTTDSGPRHFAPAFGVPVITLFGPTHIAWSETFYSLATHLQIPVDCGPCQRRTCPFGHHRCMRDLSVDRVFAAVARVLEPVRDRSRTDSRSGREAA